MEANDGKHDRNRLIVVLRRASWLAIGAFTLKGAVWLALAWFALR